MVILQSRIYRADLKANPGIIYVFGDNEERWGFGGQAAEMRGEPNAVGVATLRAPGVFWSDGHMYAVHQMAVIDTDMAPLFGAARAGRTIVFPLDGIGTGLADLERRAPTTFAYLQAQVDLLKQIGETDMATRAKKTTAPEAPTVAGIKGYGPDLACRGFQFKIGETYTHEGRVKACEGGFHAITDHPLAVFDYYPPAGSRFTRVTLSGEMHTDDKIKTAAEIVTIGEELGLSVLTQEAVAWVMARAKPEGERATGYQGAASATGVQGAASATGDRGAASATGVQGAASATGYRGAASATGVQGAASATGVQGAASATGYRGAASATGDRGAASATGVQGAASATGVQGAASATGDRGAASATGVQGAASATGYQGAASATGVQGAASATGVQGAASATGDRGAASATGVQGAASATGYQGAASATGVQGAASATGVQGAASATGVQGAASATGYQGAASATGVQGAASATGVQGAASATGVQGAAMASGFLGQVRGADGNALFAVERESWNGPVISVACGVAGRDGIKADTFYRCKGGKMVECAQ